MRALSFSPLSAIPALLLTLLLASPVAAAPAATVYLAVGDSLAWGDGASDPATTAYVPLLADYFSGASHGGARQLANVSVRGETTQSFIDSQLAVALAAIGDPSTDTRVVTVSIGGNDLLDLLNEPTDPCVQDPTSPVCQFLVFQALQGVAQRYPVILGSMAAALADDPGYEQVYVLTLYNPFGGSGSPFEVAVDGGLLGADLTIDCAAAAVNPLNAGLDDIISCTANAFGNVVVDGYAAISDDALALTHIGDPGFNIHPNDDGYEAIAKAHRL